MRYFAFQWHITDACDQRCRHCYIFSENPERTIDEMSFEQMEHVLNSCLDFCKENGRKPYFYITGGDPILHPDFWKLAALLKDKGIPYSILGNPFHLNRENLARLKETGCEKYQLSLDGSQKTHDWFRKPGSFDITLEKIGLINEAGLRSVIMTTISSANASELFQIMDAAVKANTGLFAFARYCPTSADKDTGLPALEYRKILSDYLNRAAEYRKQGCTTSFSKKDHLFTLLDYEEGRFQIPENADPEMIYDGCSCGSGHLTILPNGDVYACRRVMNSKTGNALNQSISEIWFGKMEEYREFDAFKKCAKCELRGFCRGCPAVAAGKTGSFYEEDPQCWKEIIHHSTSIDN